jgi:hypothetical protein
VFGFGDHGFFADGEQEGVAKFEAEVAFGVGWERADEEGFAAHDDGIVCIAVAIEQGVAVTVEVEGWILERDDSYAGFDANAVLIGGDGELHGAITAGEQVVAGGLPCSAGALRAGRGGEKRMGAAESAPARRDDDMLGCARGERGVGVEAADEAFGFGRVIEHNWPTLRDNCALVKSV